MLCDISFFIESYELVPTIQTKPVDVKKDVPPTAFHTIPTKKVTKKKKQRNKLQNRQLESAFETGMLYSTFVCALFENARFLDSLSSQCPKSCYQFAACSKYVVEVRKI